MVIADDPQNSLKLSTQELLDEATHSNSHIAAGIFYALFVNNAMKPEKKTIGDYYGLHKNSPIQIALIGCRRDFWCKLECGLLVTGNMSEPKLNHIRGRSRMGVFHRELSDEARTSYAYSLKTVGAVCNADPTLIRPVALMGSPGVTHE